jgi:flavin reductase (DIM6/NTAB) family NADH-FMN oxidoreductase RutF
VPDLDNRALQKISYGLYVVTSGRESSSKFSGQIANTVFQVTSQPETIAVSINKSNFTHSLIKETNIFAVSVLSKDAPLRFIGSFGFRCGRDMDKFEGVEFKVGKTGTRIVLDHSIAYVEAEVIKEVDMETHTIFVGKIIEAQVLKDDEPMTYAYYHEIKGGTTPASAPTYSKVSDAKDSERVSESS